MNMKAIRSEWLAVMMAAFGLGVALPSFGGGAFSASDPLGNGNLDASVGLSTAKTYTHAYNIRGGDVTINGVVFTGVPNFTGVEGVFEMSGWWSSYGPDDGGRVIGAGSGLNTLLSTFNYNGSLDTLTLKSLTAGQTYILTFYNKAWLAAGYDRVLAVTSSGGAATTFDENMGSDVNANLLRYTFTASSDTEWVRFVPIISGTMHFYGFTAEQVFNNAWSGGANWTTATWGAPGVPNAPGANAVFAAQGSPTAISLNAPVTVGHLQFDGANAWTVSGASPLTLQADVGGVSVLSAPSGSHTISAAITLNNDLMKEGAGSLTLAGTVSGAGSVSVNAGTLEITAADTLPVSTAVEIAADAFLKLSNASTQTVAVLTFGGALQRSGTWGAEGSGAQYTSARLTGTGRLRVLGGPAVGAFTASGPLMGGSDLDASVGLDAGKTYFSAVNVFGGALTINGVPFTGSAGSNPAGVTYSTANFGNWNSTPQSTVSGQLGLLLNDFNYGDGATPQTFTLRNLALGHRYILTFYNRVWGAFDDRTQSITTTSGATTTFNEDNGPAETANWLRYTFIASGPSETLTMTPISPSKGSFHLYGFSVSTEPAGEYTDVTRRDSGSKVIADSLLSDVRIVEGTGEPGDITLGAATTAINSLTESATEGVATIDAGNGILALNSLLLEAGAGGLEINNGILKCAGSSLLVDTLSPNPVTVNAVIANGTGSSTLVKTGSGTLTLNAQSGYLGGTTVNGGTLRITGSGTLGNGPLLSVDGGTLQVDGGSVSPGYGDAWRVRIANGTVNQTAGYFGYGGYIQILDSTLNLSGGSSGVGLENLLGWGGANTTVNISGSHVADWYVTRFNGGSCTLNLLSGGTLYTDQLFSLDAAGAVRFDGGKLGMSGRDPGRTPGDWIYVVGGSLTLNVENGGAIIDTAYGNATINRPLLRDGASTGGLTKTGANTLTLTSLSTYAGDTQVQGGTLKLTPVPALALVNAGFELPAFGPGGWSYLNGDGVPGGWSITAGGIARSGAPWVANAPQGLQIGYLQGASTFTQTIAVPVAGTYRLSFRASNRPGFDADHLAVQIDSVTLGSWLYTDINNGGAFKDYSVDVALSAGAHELKFVGASPGWDTATAIDDVQVVQIEGGVPGTLPTGTRVAVSAGAALELNGASQTLAGLSGGGRVVNSTLNNVLLTVGGDNASTSFGGTLEGTLALAKVGAGALTLSGANTYSGATLVKEGTLQLPPIGAAATVPNPSFETHDPLSMVPPEWSAPWQYAPGGAEWVFAAAGISERGSPWVHGSAGIDGTVAGFIQNAGTITGTVTVPSAGMYSLSFLAGKRPGLPATQLFVDVDGANKLMFPESALGNEIGDPFAGDLSLSTGTHSLTFRGVTTTGDNDIWLDRIALTSLGGSLPTGAVVTVSAGAVLDLNGNAQALTGLSGDGLVTNGTLAVSGVIAPGGTNVIGTLTLAASAALSGTLLMDVATDGTCDLLKVQGGLDITGLTLQIQDTNLFKGSTQYVLARFTPGGLTGRFAATNLDNARWQVSYSNSAGEIRLIGRGLLLLLN